LKWKLALDNQYVSSPAIGEDGTLYLTSVHRVSSDYFVKLNAVDADGNLIWTYDPGNSGSYSFRPSAPVIGQGGNIFVWLSNLYEIRPDGSKKWIYHIGTPAIGLNDTLYGTYGGWDLDLLAWEIHTLQALWTIHKPADSFYYRPAIGADGTIYAGCTDNGLYALDPDGTEIWRHPREFYFPAIGADGTLYCARDSDYSFYAIESDGTYGWKFDVGDYPANPVIGLDNTIIFGSWSGDLYALETDGSLKRTWSFGEPIRESAAIGDDGTIYVIVGWSAAVELYAIDPEGPVKWTYSLDDRSWYSPTIGSDGTVYVACENELLAINSSSGGLAETPWPKFCHDVACTNRAHRCPLVDIKVNGEDTNFSQSSSIPLDVTVSLDPGDRDGVPFEWWLFVEMDSAVYFWWQWPSGNWIYSFTARSAFGGPFGLRPLSDVPVASGTVPPAS